MGWSNTGAVVLTATKVVLLDADGNVVGFLDGSSGLVFFGNGSADNPGLTLTPFGDLFWGNDDANPATDPSIEVGNTEMFLSSGSDVGTDHPAVVGLMAPLGNGAVGVQVADYVYGNDRTGSGSPLPATESWKTLPVSNGWGNVAGSTPAQYRAMPDGTVMCHGTLTGGTSTTFATLPAGYRPGATVQFPAAGGTSVSAGTMLRVTITSAGVMAVVGEPAPGGSFTMDAVRFALPDLV